MDITIRPFRGDDADYVALAALRNAIYPDYPLTAAEWRRIDERRPPNHVFARFVADRAGTMVGMGTFGHMTWMYHPNKFEIGVFVHPEHQRRGIGGRLYDHMMAELAAYEPAALRYEIREDFADSVRFAQARGFVEERRGWESRLDLASFDRSRFAGKIEQVEAQGIKLHTARELEAADPEFWPKLYDLDTTVAIDVPMPEPETPPPLEQWLKFFKGSPNFIPDGLFIAVDNGHYVGLSVLWRRESTAELDTGLTGVRREYRRRGIALALKLRAIDYALSIGAPVIRTGNDATNRPMLSINEALGFQKLPAWLTILKLIREV